MNVSGIGDRIRELRKENHLTQDELAGKLDASRVQVNQWESGSRELSNARIIKLAELFGVSCDYLLTGKSENEAEGSAKPEPEIVKKKFSFADLLSENSINALNSLNDLPDEKKEIYQLVLNGILGSDAFWNVIIPAITSSIELKNDKNNAVSVSDDIKKKFDQCAQILDLANKVGYSDKFVISGEKAIDFKICEAKEIFSDLIESLIDYYSSSEDKEKPEVLKEFDPISSNKSENDDFIRFLNKFEIES